MPRVPAEKIRPRAFARTCVCVCARVRVRVQVGVRVCVCMRLCECDCERECDLHSSFVLFNNMLSYLYELLT